MTHEQVRAINGGSVIINKKKSMDENIQDAPVEAAAAEEVVAEAAPVAEEVAAPEVAAEAAPAEEAAA